MTDTITTDNPLSADAAATLKAIARLMIPASEKYDVPGADDPAIFANISATARDHVELLDAGFAALNVASGGGESFVTLPEDEQRAVIDACRTDLAEFISAVTAFTLQCYYRDPRVMASLGMEARPPFPEGYEVPRGDWAILDPVRDRGRIWRDA